MPGSEQPPRTRRSKVSDDHKGPSDRRPTRRGAGGVDAHATKAHLYDLAKRLEVPGRSSMTKDELADAISRARQSRRRAAARYSAGF